MNEIELRVAETPDLPGSTLVPGVGESVPLSQASIDSQSLHDARYYKRRLPHFEQPWMIYALTMTTRERRTLSLSARTIVLDALLHFHLKRYELVTACVMLDHVHILLQPWPRERKDDSTISFWTISTLTHSWKSFTAHRINQLERTTGPLWEEESFDRYIRSERDLQKKFEYICRNPYQARLVSPDEHYPWLWTSENGLRLGSTPVPGVGESVPLSQASLESSFRRDAETHARDGRAPRKNGGPRMDQPKP